VELIEDRAREARTVLPPGVRVLVGDAATLDLPENSLDVVYQSTVFSSILDDNLQVSVAQTMWRLLRPGGAVLWYDFTFNNPSNRDVRGVPLQRVRDLFPGGVIESRRVTLAPPLSRRVVALHPSLYGVFNAIPWLRTHVLCWIRKT
jgi:SAM-dependent methyltransferase